VLCNIARFRLCFHTLRVETGLWQIHNSSVKNDLHDVKDEKHVLFHALVWKCASRSKFAEQFADFTGTDRIYIGDTGAFYFDNTSAEDVKFFYNVLLNNVLLKQAYEPLLFLPCFLAGG